MVAFQLGVWSNGSWRKTTIYHPVQSGAIRMVNNEFVLDAQGVETFLLCIYQKIDGYWWGSKQRGNVMQFGWLRFSI